MIIDDIKSWKKIVETASAVRLDEALEDIVNTLQPYVAQDDVFVSFSDIPKLGINPRTDYNTPAGIYSYPLKQMWPAIKSNTIPYAGERQYVLVFQPRSSDGIVKVNTYTSGDFSRHMRLLEQKVIPKIAGPGVDLEQFQDFFDIAKRESKLQTPAAWLWNITRLLARMWDESYNGPKPTVGWNAIMRALGINGFNDQEGSGLIHANEPMQAVWFSANSLKLLSISRNIRKGSVSRQTQLALIQKNPDNIWRIHHPDRGMWDQALKQDAQALIGRAAREDKRIPWGALWQASRSNNSVVSWLLHYGYRLNDQQKISLVKSNIEAARYFHGSQMLNDQLARAAVATYPGVLELLALSPSLTPSLVELATELHLQDAVWAVLNLKDLSPQAEKNIKGHIGNRAWEIWRRKLQKKLIDTTAE